jgi:hypothetical protein
LFVLHLQCCNCYAHSNVMFLLHFQCGAHFTEFTITLWYATMMSNREFGLCLECVYWSPLAHWRSLCSAT